MTETGPSYVNMRLGPRAPRVAIVFNGGEKWEYWARLALHAATKVWGGRGFILVPHVSGVVDPVLLQAVMAYDPDYVVLLQPTIGQYEQAHPGRLPLSLGGGPASGEARARLVEQVRDDPIEDRNGSRAREAVVSVCSSHRRRAPDGGAERWSEHITLLSVGSLGRPLTMVSDIPGIPARRYASAPSDWAGPLGVMVAAMCGALPEPAAGGLPTLEPARQREVLRWLLRFDGVEGMPPPELLIDEDPEAEPDQLAVSPAFEPTTHGLASVRTGIPSEQPILLVVGDTVNDFAAAVAWDRIYGRGIWVPTDWSPAREGEDQVNLRLLFHSSVVARAAYHGEKVLVGTVSAGEDAVAQVVAALHGPGMLLGAGGEEQQRRYAEAVVSGPIRFGRVGALHWAVADQFDQQYALPVNRDDDGATTMVAPPPVPVITHADLSRCESLTWQVDADVWRSPMPRGRGLNGNFLLAPGEDEYLTWVRSGRDGISYESHRYNLVLAGTPRLSLLARPSLREPGVREWATLVAEQQGRSIDLSDAGRRVEILRRLWGSRKELAATMAGPLLPVLHGFAVNAKASKDAYPNKEGVVLGGEGYLTFMGMARLGGRDEDLAGLRRDADLLLALRVLRRGLVLDCGECGRPVFTDVNDLGQVNPCPRCGARNELSQSRWREPADEPTWFYDLHPAVRELLAQNGEVPLLLSHYLRGKSRRYADSPEVELYDSTTRRRLAEADLVALTDDDLVTAEAKSISTLGRNTTEVKRAAAKRIEIAAVLHADQIVLATTLSEWVASSLTALREAVAGYPWPARREPSVRIVTSLGTPNLKDQRLETDTGELTSW